MDAWFYAWLRIKRAHDHGSLEIDPKARDGILEQMLAHIASGWRGRRDPALVAFLEKACTETRFVLENLSGEDSDDIEKFLLGFESALQILLFAAKKR